MTTRLPRWFAGLVLVLPFVPLLAADPDDAEIARLVKQLGSSDFRIRDAATKCLTEIGEPALDALVRATKSDDVEARRRAEAILTVVENRLCVEERRLIHTTTPLPVSGASTPGLLGSPLGQGRFLAAAAFIRGSTPTTVDYLQISADGKRLLTKCSGVGAQNWQRDATFRLWDVDKAAELSRFQIRNYSVRFEWPGQAGNCAALSPCGKRVLGSAAYSDLWDATTGKELCKASASGGGAFAVCFGPKGKALTGAYWTMCLWDLDTGATIHEFRHESWCTCVAYSDQAKLAASGGGYYPSILLWDLETRKEVRRLRVNTQEVYALCFAPDGKRLLSTGMEGTLRIWDVQSGAELQRIQAHKAPGDVATYCAAVFSPDGRRIVSTGLDGVLHLWDAQTGKQLRTYAGHRGRVLAVAFFPDGQRIASAGADGTVRIWRAPR